MPARAPVRWCRVTHRPPVSATATNASSALSATPLANASPSSTTSGLPTRREPQEPAGARHPDEVGLPLLDAVQARRVREPDRAVRRDGGVVAEPHPYAVHVGREDLDRPAVDVDPQQATVGVADEEPAVGRELEPERPAPGPGDPRIRAPSGDTCQIAPSSVPVKTSPECGPWVATRTSSAPGPGTGWTVSMGALLGVGIGMGEVGWRQCPPGSGRWPRRPRPARVVGCAGGQSGRARSMSSPTTKARLMPSPAASSGLS